MSASAAERMKRSRDRRRRGEMLVPLFIRAWGVQRLVALGLLDADRAADVEAVRAGVQYLLGVALAAGDGIVREDQESARRLGGG